jgi:hypothetical protein
MSPLRILLKLISAVVFTTTAPANAHEFLWRTESVSAEIKRDDQFLRIGQYLLLEQILRPNETGWKMMKISINRGQTTVFGLILRG